MVTALETNQRPFSVELGYGPERRRLENYCLSVSSLIDAEGYANREPAKGARGGGAPGKCYCEEDPGCGRGVVAAIILQLAVTAGVAICWGLSSLLR